MSLRPFLLLMSISGVTALPLPAEASQPLIPLRDATALRQWQVGQNALKRDGIGVSPKFALEGSYSLMLTAPAWQPGRPEWPLWQTKNSFPKDWSGYDRLLVDLVNPTDAVALVGIKTVDAETSALPSSNWGGTKVTVQRRAHLRALIPLEILMKGIRKQQMDRQDITTLMFYATRPGSDFQLHVSGIRLLRAGEQPPELPTDYIRQLVDLSIAPSLSKSHNAANVTEEALRPFSDDIKAWADRDFADLKRHLGDLEREAESAALKEGDIAPLANRLEALAMKIQRLPSLAAVREAVRSSDQSYVAGWVSPMQKVIPQEMPLPDLRRSANGTLSLARNEHEGIQLVVIPVGQELRNVHVEIRPFVLSDGTQLPAEAIKVQTVGYVRTAQVAYEVDYSGWWPDPLLDFLPTVNIAPDVAQSFWIGAHAPKDQPAGVYRGEIVIRAENAPPLTRKLEIRVRDFTLPGTPPIPVAIPSYSQRYFQEFSSGDWEQEKLRIADFQADYYIGWDNLYDPRGPDWEVLEHLKKQGRAAKFNLYPLGFDRPSILRADAKEGGLDRAIAALVAKIRPIYDEARKRNLLEHAYLYGMDELPVEQFPQLEKITKALKAAFPDVPLVTTAQDFTYGAQSGIGSIDAWVPLIHEYDPQKAEAARAKGKQVWWYNCKTPAHPYPNQFTEYPAIELRLLHGAMSAKYRPDGFLYYSLFRSWQLKGKPPRKAIDHGPYTDWDPCALAFSEYDIYNGEGYLAYPGPDGRPLSSIRLENFRDGFDDLAYWHLLKARVEALTGKSSLSAAQEQWLKEAQAALVVPDNVVKSAHEFTLNPDNVLKWREHLARLIESAPFLPSTPTPSEN